MRAEIGFGVGKWRGTLYWILVANVPLVRWLNTHSAVNSSIHVAQIWIIDLTCFALGPFTNGVATAYGRRGATKSDGL